MTTTTAQKQKVEKKPFDAKKDNEVRQKLIVARVGLLLRAPFFGNLATRLELTNADDWLPTAATDGRKFYYNTDFCMKLNNKELEFLFGHEVLHCVYDHIGRFGTRDKQLANIAADYVVNADLVEQRIGETIKAVPILYDKKYLGWSFEQVYEDLYDKAEKIDISKLVQQVLDGHLDGDDDGDDGEGGGADKLTPEEKQQIKDEIREAMINAAQAAGAGNLPSGVRRMINDLTEPKMNWRELLQQQIESCVKSDFTWMKPSRRGWHSDAILPGMKNGDTIDIAVAIDTSGSITDAMLKDFLGEVYGIMGMYDDYKITLWCFDTSIHNPQVFTADNGDELLEYKAAGGGGTSFQANWNWMKDNEIVPKRFIMFTDLESYDGFGDEDYCETIFIAHKTDKVASHGITCKYD